MILVTGGAGFIGSNIISGLNKLGLNDILVVDNLKNGYKMRNLSDVNISDYIDFRAFEEQIKQGLSFNKTDVLFHLGACSSTTEWDGEFMMNNNFQYSKLLFNWCQNCKVQFIYASSASVYGLGEHGFKEERHCEKPINMYAYSKFLFDQYVRSKLHNASQQVVGLRYFNVYGPHESHKGSMASTAYHFYNQLNSDGNIRLFKGINQYADGEQQRDFVYVKDIVDVNLWFMANANKSGIFNVGSGKAVSFNQVGKTILNWHVKSGGVNGEIVYIDFPKKLEKSYQNYTQADLTALRQIGYEGSFHSIEEGINDYLHFLSMNK